MKCIDNVAQQSGKGAKQSRTKSPANHRTNIGRRWLACYTAPRGTDGWGPGSSSELARGGEVRVQTQLGPKKLFFLPSRDFLNSEVD